MGGIWTPNDFIIPDAESMLTPLPEEWVSSSKVSAILASRFERMQDVGVIISGGPDLRTGIDNEHKIVDELVKKRERDAKRQGCSI